MRRANQTNTNTKTYWNGVYGSPEMREGYAATGTSHAAPNSLQATKRFSTALEYVTAKDKVIDLGCGVGVFTQLVKKTYPDCDVWGVDISDKVIHDNLHAHPGITYRHGYIGHLPKLPQGTYDVVFCGETIEHLDDPADAFKDAYRLLKPGGLFVVTTPRDEHIKSEEHTWYFDEQDVVKLFADNGFTDVKLRNLPDMEWLYIIFGVGRKV